MSNAYTTLQRVTGGQNYIDQVRQKLHCLTPRELLELLNFFDVDPGRHPDFLFARKVYNELAEGEINLTIENIEGGTHLVRNLDVVRLKIHHKDCERVTLYIKKIFGANGREITSYERFNRPSGKIMHTDRLEARNRGLSSIQVATEREAWEECRLLDTDYDMSIEPTEISFTRASHIGRSMYKRTTLHQVRLNLKCSLPSMYTEDITSHKTYIFEWRETRGPLQSDTRVIRMHDEVTKTLRYNEPL